MVQVRFRQNCKGRMPDGKKDYPQECEMEEAEAKKFISYAMADIVMRELRSAPEAITEVSDPPSGGVASRAFLDEVDGLKARRQVKAVLSDWGVAGLNDIPGDRRSDFIEAVKSQQEK